MGMQSPSAGPWRSLRIEASAVARIDDWRVSQIHRADGAVDLTIFLQPTTGADLAVRAELHLGEMLVASTEQSFWGGWEWQLTVENPALWWPNGMGAQPLYTLTLTLCDASGQPLDSVIRRLGLRTCELVREPDEWGRSMFFKVNGRRFFAKGSNWIPLDAHPSAQNLDARYRRDLTSARDAHMNMLRVWGGGYFAHDAFYDLCDELGLLVWQDLMFGCGAYPVWDERFRDSVWHETTDNARRLRHHACLACWCGNNELELGFTAPAWEANSGTQQNVGMLAWASYLELFDRVLPSALALADPSTHSKTTENIRTASSASLDSNHFPMPTSSANSLRPEKRSRLTLRGSPSASAARRATRASWRKLSSGSGPLPISTGFALLASSCTDSE